MNSHKAVLLTGLQPSGTSPGPSNDALKNSLNIRYTQTQNIPRWARPPKSVGGYHDNVANNAHTNNTVMIVSAVIGPQCSSLLNSLIYASFLGSVGV